MWQWESWVHVGIHLVGIAAERSVGCWLGDFDKGERI